jgi:hypothetical protein
VDPADIIEHCREVGTDLRTRWHKFYIGSILRGWLIWASVQGIDHLSKSDIKFVGRDGDPPARAYGNVAT